MWYLRPPTLSHDTKRCSLPVCNCAQEILQHDECNLRKHFPDNTAYRNDNAHISILRSGQVLSKKSRRPGPHLTLYFPTIISVLRLGSSRESVRRWDQGGHSPVMIKFPDFSLTFPYTEYRPSQQYSDIKNALISLCNTHIYWHIYDNYILQYTPMG